MLTNEYSVPSSDVGDVHVEVLLAPVTAEARHGEQGDAREQQRQAREQQVRAELAPPRPGQVDDPPYDHVGERVPEPHQQEHRGHYRRVEADDVGVVDHEEQALQGECEIVGEVPGGVPGVAPEG